MNVRVCPERDAVCPHGMKCPWAVDQYSCRIGYGKSPNGARPADPSDLARDDQINWKARAEALEGERERLANLADERAERMGELHYRATKAEADRDEWKATARHTAIGNRTLVIRATEAEAARSEAEADLADANTTIEALSEKLSVLVPALEGQVTFLKADLARAKEALTRIREATPANTNSTTAREFWSWTTAVSAVALAALKDSPRAHDVLKALEGE